MNIKIKYFSEDYPRLEKICKGDWIDLRIDSMLECNGETVEGMTELKRQQTNGVDLNELELLARNLGRTNNTSLLHSRDIIMGGLVALEPDTLSYNQGDILKFGLGVAMELPKGYEAIVVPRSSTFKHWGLIQTNSPGVIDNSYCGDNDEWMVEFIAMRDGRINRFDRVCQFRIQENQPDIEFEEVDHLGNKDRGSYGSTGKQ